MVNPPALADALDIEKLKGLHRCFVTGVTAVTTMESDAPRGLIVNAFSSLSLDPPTVLVCVQKSSRSYPALFSNDLLAINILAAEQERECQSLASKQPDKFAQVNWHPGPHGAPVLTAAAAWLEATITERIQASTHTLFIARVLAAEFTRRAPLLYAGGRFFDGSVLESSRPHPFARNEYSHV